MPRNTLITLLAVLGLSAQPGPPPAARAIEVWHGDTQKVGHLGDAQDDFNLMGRVRPWQDVDTLFWRIATWEETPLAFRAFRRRPASRMAKRSRKRSRSSRSPAPVRFP